MDARALRTMDGCLRGPADHRFAVFAQPPGERDLGCQVLWAQSLERSRRRRRAAAQRGFVLPASAKARVSATLVAATLVGTAAPVAGAAANTHVVSGADALKRGARGDRVAAAQGALGIAADGVFGRQTHRAVRAFQRAHGLVVDGTIGPQTSAALGLAATSAGAARTALTRTVALAKPVAVAPSPSVTAAVQRALGVSADGVFGPLTRSALLAYQRAHGLTADGIVGPQVLGALGLSNGAAATSSPAVGTAGSVATTVASVAQSSGSGVQAAVAAAQSKAGSPYSYGATGPNAFDCSGLTSWAMSQAGIAVPRTSFAQFTTGSAVSSDGIQAGDLVFFNTAGAGASDVGIATGPTTAVSATTHGVMAHAIFDSYWGSHFVGARRVG